MSQNQLAIVKKGVVDIVQKKINEFQANNELHLPKGYSPDNAMKSAFLILQNTVDRNKKPVLDVCSQNSIANCLLDMVVQGLNPAKKQMYFIAYGTTLTCHRSYFGSMAVVKNLCGAIDIFAQVVWEGDVFEYEINRGNKIVTSHTQKIENVGKNPVAAYCIIVFPEDFEYTDIMTIDQIKKAWSKSKMDHSRPESVHNQFSEEMIRKTVINRACKKYINSSSDNAILIERMNNADELSTEIAFENEVAQNANAEIIDIVPEPTLTDVEEQEAKQGPDLTEKDIAEIKANEAKQAEEENKNKKGPNF